MADNNNPRYDHQMLTLALALPYVNRSNEQIQEEHLSDKQLIIEKYSNSSFFNDMADYVNTFTSENYSCNYFDINSFNSKHSNKDIYSHIFP